MRLQIRTGTLALGLGAFYHPQKRILYLHPLPFIALVIYFAKDPA